MTILRTSNFLFELIRSDRAYRADFCGEVVRKFKVKTEKKYSLKVTTDISLVTQANRLAAESYGAIEPIPDERYNKWHEKNPYILVCLVDEYEKVIGYFDFLFFNQAFLPQFINGAVDEHDIRIDHILSPNEILTSKGGYLAGVAVPSSQGFVGKRYASMLVWGVFKYLEWLFPQLGKYDLYASGSSNEGIKLIQRFGFERIINQRERKDTLPIFCLKLTKEILNQIILSLPDWSSCCELKFGKHSAVDL